MNRISLWLLGYCDDNVQTLLLSDREMEALSVERLQVNKLENGKKQREK